MFKYLLFNLFFLLPLNSILHGQKREEKVQLITTLVERTKSDTTLKFFVFSKEKLSFAGPIVPNIEMIWMTVGQSQKIKRKIKTHKKITLIKDLQNSLRDRGQEQQMLQL